MHNTAEKATRPLAVLLGDVGVGKSFAVEKVSGQHGLSSDAQESCTRSARFYVSTCGRLEIADTPGRNAISDKPEHAQEIISALLARPVSVLLLVVKAETRIDGTMSQIQGYLDSFVDFADVLGICVTHMDIVEWGASSILPHIEEECGFPAICLGRDTSGEELTNDILGVCQEPHDLTRLITPATIRILFPIPDSTTKIMCIVGKEVDKCKNMQSSCFEQREFYNQQDHIRLMFEFWAFMQEFYIADVQRRIAAILALECSEKSGALEHGHLANMTAQIHVALAPTRDFVTEVTPFQTGDIARQCPYCGKIWRQWPLPIPGSDMEDKGTAEFLCISSGGGNESAARSLEDGVMATFRFPWRDATLTPFKRMANPGTLGYCGRVVSWKNMAPVSLTFANLEAANEYPAPVGVLHPPGGVSMEDAAKSALPLENGNDEPDESDSPRYMCCYPFVGVCGLFRIVFGRSLPSRP